MGTQELAVIREEVVTLVCQAFRDILAFQVSRGIVGFQVTQALAEYLVTLVLAGIPELQDSVESLATQALKEFLDIPEFQDSVESLAIQELAVIQE